MAEATPPITHPTLVTDDGIELAADLAEPDERRGLALLAHPHPEYGGSRHVYMIEAWFRALPAAGLTTIRFDFRGGGGSGGTHTGGQLEHLDVSAAVAALPGIGDLPLLAAGWSFGAEVLLAHRAPEIATWVAVAPPASQRPEGTPAGADQRPTLILAPEHDQFAPPDVARTATDGWIATEVEAIPGTDHSLMGAADRIVARTLQAFEALGPTPEASAGER
jgi:hypothetical protein